MLDIVAALEWIRDNISNFGGDPGNVTIMGQSGGGAKVCTLTAMPSAQGLFSKAVALSGTGLKAGEKENSERLASYILKEARLNPSQIDKLQEMTWRDYYALSNSAVRKMREESGDMGMMGGFSPVADGHYVSQHPFSPEASPLAKDISMIVCSTFYERSPSSFDSSLEDITLDKAKEMVKTTRGFGRMQFGENGSEVIDAYARSFPDRKPIEILSMVISNRQSQINLCNAKSRQNGAPVYLA